MNTHNKDEDFGKEDINAHLELFSLWCLGIHQGKVAETRFSVAPDDGKLNNWYACLHRTNIMPSIKAAASLPASTMNTTNILWSFAAGISRTSEEAEHQNKIHPEQLDYIKEKDAKKNNKAEKWHPTSQCLVLNAALTNSSSPAEEIPQSYLRIINSNTTGMADRELQTQMSELGHSDTGFAHGLATSLYMEDIMWNNQSSPSNLSLFTIFKLDPLSSIQMARCLHLHHLSKNTKGKSMDEIKASQIQEVKVPTTFEELHQSLLFYSGIASILFGTGSSLVTRVNSLANAIKTEKIVFKECIASNSDLPTKILYAMEIRIQHWLAKCQKLIDRSMVNNRLISFDKKFEMVMNSPLNVILPPNFIKPPPKNPSPELNPTQGLDSKQKRKGKKRKSDEAT